MDLNQLRYFAVIAKYESFTQAANELMVAQPALSQSMKSLETSLGVELFIRSGKSIVLSPCGAELQRRLQSILPQIETLPAVLRRIKRLANTTINIAITVASAYFIPIIMSDFAVHHPEITLRFHSSNRTFCDFIISSNPPAGDMRGAKIMENQEIFLLVPENSELAAHEGVRLVDARDRRFILQTQNHSIRHTIDSYFAQAGFQPQVGIECDFLFMIPELVRQNYGIAVTSFDDAADYQDLKLLHITSPACTRDIYLTWREQAPFTSSMNQFYEFMGKHFPLLKTGTVSHSEGTAFK